MEDMNSTDVFSDDKVENMQYFEENQDQQGISKYSLPKFLKASELCSLRSYINKNKNDCEEMEVSKGPKLYYPNDASDEVVESVMEVVKKSLELERISKNRDNIKAEWSDELRVAFVPYLKKKSAQHMGISVKGKYALLPEEALFLLEKGLIEILHNQMPLSVEEAYAVMLQGKLAIENYEVYSFLSQLGYIVVHNQSRIRSCYEKILTSLQASTTRKRKMDDPSVELPEHKRVTFSGLLASNANKISVSEENLVHSLNSSDRPSSEQPVPEETDSLVNNNQDENNKAPKMDEKTSEGSKEATISPDSTCVEFDSSQNEAQMSCDKFEGENGAIENFACLNNSERADLNVETVNNVAEENANVCENIDDSNTENGHINKQIKNYDTKMVNDADDIDVVNCLDENQVDIDLIDNVKNLENEKSVKNSQDKCEVNKENNDETEIDVENTNDDNEIENGQDYIDVELTEETGVDTNNGDTNDVIIEKEHTGKQNGSIDNVDDINVEDSESDDYSKDYESSDDCTSIVCDESNDRSIDVYSISPRGDQNQFGDKIKDNLPTNDQDDEVTLVEVKKKETKPLAVIDLLSDEEDISDQSKNTNDKQSSGEDVFEDSDEEIQVLNEVSVPKNNTLNSSGNRNSVKLETKKLKIPVKTAYIPKLKFPEAFKKDMLCIPRPPDHVLPFKVQPCKEAYVLTFSRAQQKKKMWNSYRDMQDYQRERRLGRLMNSSRSHSFKSQTDLVSNRSSPYSVPESSRSDGFIRNDPNPSHLPSLYQPSPINQGESNLERHMNSFKFRLNSLRDQSSPVNVPESSRDDGFVRSDRDYSFIQNLHQPSLMNPLQRPSFLPRPNILNPQNHMPFAMNLNNLQNLSSSNPAAFVNEIQKTVYSVATSMISSMLGQHLHPNSSSPMPNLPFSESSMINVTSHVHNSNFTTSSSYPSPFMYNSSGRNEIPPMRFPTEPVFSNERYSNPMYDSYSAGNNWRQPSNFRQRNFAHRGPSFPCTYRTVRRKRDWHDVKAAVEGSADSDSGSDIVEVPIDMNKFLWSNPNDIQPMIKRGPTLPVVADLQKELRMTEMANLCDTKRSIERYLPVTLSLEISFDVYLPSSKFKRSEPCVPNYRIIVVRSCDHIPKYSELVDLQRKYGDGASLQIAVVDHSDISFYSFNSVHLPEIIPFDS